MKKTTTTDAWNYYMELIAARHQQFIDEVLGDNKPDKIYQVHANGNLQESFVTSIGYNIYADSLFYSGKSPKQDDVDRITKYYHYPPVLTKENITFEYYHIWGDGLKASSTYFLFDEKKCPGLFTDKELAERRSIELKEIFRQDQEWLALHKKDASFNYGAAGYKFIGWQNSWNHVYYDTDGKVTTDPAKKKTFGYRTEDYPEYGKCRDAGHKQITVHHNNRGTENTVSCPECKIYWKYDSSD